MNDLIIFCGLLAFACYWTGRAVKSNREYYQLKRELTRTRK